MNLNVEVLNPLVALIAGILILLMPRLLNYVVAVYLIVIGLLGAPFPFPHLGRRLRPAPFFADQRRNAT